MLLISERIKFLQIQMLLTFFVSFYVCESSLLSYKLKNIKSLDFLRDLEGKTVCVCQRFYFMLYRCLIQKINTMELICMIQRINTMKLILEAPLQVQCMC